MPETRPGEATVNLVLRTLQQMANPDTIRMEGGRRVADVEPAWGRADWSLPRTVAERLNDVRSVATVANCISVLVRRGYLQPGRTGMVMRRWVVMDVSFRYGSS